MFIELEKKLLNSLESLIKSNNVKISLCDYINFKDKILEIRKQNYSILYNLDFSSNKDYLCWDKDDNNKFHKFKVYSFDRLFLDFDYKNLDLDNKYIKNFIKLINEIKLVYKNHYEIKQKQILEGDDNYKKMIYNYILFYNKGLKENNNIDLLKPKLEQIKKDIEKQIEKRSKLKDRLKYLKDEIDKIENGEVKIIKKVIFKKDLEIERNKKNNLKVMEVKTNNRGSHPTKIYRIKPIIVKPLKVKSYQDILSERNINLVNKKQILKRYIKYVNKQKK